MTEFRQHGQRRVRCSRLTLAVLGIALSAALSASSPLPAQAQPACTFTDGFRVIHNLIPHVVGDCLEHPQVEPKYGNVEQRTTGGLMVWQRNYNLATFTDGSTTWVLGPLGLQNRPNTECFSWEIHSGPGNVSPYPDCFEQREGR